MLPAIARHAIATYSEPGNLVLDPMCGVGTSLVEAIELGRQAVGVELEPRWASVAAANVRLAQERGATGRALVLRGDARELGRGLAADLAGEVRLILTSPPYGSSIHGRVRPRTNRVHKYGDHYGDSPANLGELAESGRGARLFQRGIAAIFAGCARMLAPGGRLVMTARPYRRDRQLVDLPEQLIAAASAAGLAYEARHVALLCGLKQDDFVSRASFFQIRWQRDGRIPRMLVIGHEDVLVLRRPG